MNATTIGSEVRLENSSGDFIPATIVKINEKTTVVEIAGSGNKRTFNGVPSESGWVQLRERGNSYSAAILWLDVEAANKEVALRQKRRAEAAAAKAKEKAAKIAAEDAAVADMIERATVLKNFRAADSSELAQVDEWVRRDIGSGWLNAHEELQQRARQLRLYPASYFEWAESDMKLAAQQEIYSAFIYQIKKGESSLAAIVAYMAETITRQLLENYDRPSSTSAAHNAMMICKAEVRSQMLREGSRWDSQFKKLESPETVTTTTSPVA